MAFFMTKNTIEIGRNKKKVLKQKKLFSFFLPIFCPNKSSEKKGKSNRAIMWGLGK